MSVAYEWDVEVVTDRETDDHEEGEVIDHNFCASYAAAKAVAATDLGHGLRHLLVLVRDDEKERSWAYLEEGELPTHFQDSYQNQYAKVPQRFHKEVAAI